MNHDLIAAGLLVAAVAAAWAIGISVNRWLGVLALVPIIASVGWIAAAVVDAPSLPAGTAEQQQRRELPGHGQSCRFSSRARARRTASCNFRSSSFFGSASAQ